MRAGVGWQGIPVSHHLLGELDEVTNAGIGNVAQFSKMRTQSVGEHGPLPYVKGSGAMGHKNTLLLDRLDGYELHCWPLHGFADRFGV